MAGLRSRTRYEETGDPAYREEAIELYAAGAQVAVLPEHKAVHLGELGLLVKDRGGIDNLKVAIGMIGEAADLAADAEAHGRYLYNLGRVLGRLADATGRYDTLLESLDAYRAALPLVEAEIHGPCANNLASSLVSAGRRGDRSELLREAFELALATWERYPDDPRLEVSLWDTMLTAHPEQWAPPETLLSLLETARTLADAPAPDTLRAERIERLCVLLFRADDLTEDPAHLADLVDAGRRALALPLTGAPRGRAEANLALALRDTGVRDRNADLLEEAVLLLRAAVEHTPEDDPRRASLRGDLSGALFALAGLTDDTAGAREMVEHATAAVEAAQDPESRASELASLAGALQLLAVETEDPRHLDQAVARYRQALTTPSDQMIRWAVLANLARTLELRAELSDTPPIDDLKAAIDATSEALALQPRDHPSRETLLAAYARLHLELPEAGGSADHLDLCVFAWESVIAQTTVEGLTAECLGLLVSTYRRRYELRHDPADLDRAVERADRALDLLDPDDPITPDVLSDLAIALRIRYGATGSREDLNRSVTSGAAGLEAAAPDDPRLPDWLAQQSANLRERFFEVGDPNDLENAVELAERARFLSEHPDGVVLVHLGAALGQRYQAYGRAPDLDEAIDAYRRAYEAVPDEGRTSEFAIATLTNLAMALLPRYERHRIPSDLDDAIAALETVLAATPSSHRNRSARLMTMAQALLRRSSREESDSEETGHADLRQAVGYAHEAFLLAPAGTVRHRTAVSMLLGVHTSLGRPADTDGYDEAIGIGLDAVNEGDHGHGWAFIAYNTGHALLERWRETSAAVDLNTAIDLLRAAVEAFRADGEEGSPASLMLGRALTLRTTEIDDPADRAEASAALREVAALDTAHSRLRYRAALEWTAVADPAHDDLLNGCRQVLDLLRLAAFPGASRAVQESWLAETYGIASQTARLALDADRPDLAVEFLESGRAVLWSRLLEARTDLTVIAETDPDLAARMVEVRNELDRLAPSPTDGFQNQPETDSAPPDRDWVEALLQSADLLQSGDKDTMFEVLSSAAESDSPLVIAAAESGRGFRLLELGDRASAKIALHRAMTDGEGTLAVVSAITLGNLLLEEVDLDGARAAYQRAVTLAEGDEAAEATARLLDLDALETGGSNLVERLIATADPDSLRSAFLALAEEERYDEALPFLEALHVLAPDPINSAALAELRASAGDYPGARAAWEHALTATDTEAAARATLSLADLLVAEFTVAEALPHYQSAVNGPDPTTASTARERLAVLNPAPPGRSVQFDFGRWIAHREPAETALATLTDGAPSARTQYYLAEVIPEDDPEQSSAALLNAIMLADPAEQALTALCRGQIRHLRGDTAGARTTYETAHRRALEEGDAELAAMSAIHLAILLNSEGDTDGSRAAYERAIGTGHVHYSVLASFNLARILQEQGDEDEARDIYRRIISSRHPVQASVAAINLGTSLLEAGDTEAARAAFTEAINGPWKEGAVNGRAWLARLPNS
jgi:tetratricopeptide (TPR) repeat protein